MFMAIQETEEMQKEAEEALKYQKEVVIPAQEEEAKEAIEEFEKVIDTEKTMLDKFGVNVSQDIKVKYGDDLLVFTVRPIESSDNLSKIGLDFESFSDFSVKELKILKKKNNGEKLRPEEEKIATDIEAQLMSNAAKNQLDSIHNILATFVTPPMFNSTKNKKKRFEKRLEWWKARPFNLKMVIAGEASKILGIDDNTTVEVFH